MRFTTTTELADLSPRAAAALAGIAERAARDTTLLEDLLIVAGAPQGFRHAAVLQMRRVGQRLRQAPRAVGPVFHIADYRHDPHDRSP
ncbi:MAG: hypothetical protein GX591_13215 [Planctomycetes bacterium]|nr:hypothetical protein [Planctomycetota bacterium]